jgi:hypothetical protein
MEKQISSSLKVTFQVHVVVGALFGLALLFIPECWLGLFGWQIVDAEPYRLVGAAILAFAASSWWAYREAVVDKVRIVVNMEIVWTVLASLVILYGLIAGLLPAVGWLNFIIMAAFAVAFVVFRPQE